jgi:hypothetical protein
VLVRTGFLEPLSASHSRPSLGAVDRLDLDLSVTANQQVDEAILREVGDSILAIEVAHERCQRALASAARHRADPLVIQALEDATAQLAETRRRLHQGTYLRSTQQKLL